MFVKEVIPISVPDVPVVKNWVVLDNPLIETIPDPATPRAFHEDPSYTYNWLSLVLKYILPFWVLR